jgi:hypothetical protein
MDNRFTQRDNEQVDTDRVVLDEHDDTRGCLSRLKGPNKKPPQARTAELSPTKAAPSSFHDEQKDTEREFVDNHGHIGVPNIQMVPWEPTSSRVWWGAKAVESSAMNTASSSSDDEQKDTERVVLGDHAILNPERPARK